MTFSKRADRPRWCLLNHSTAGLVNGYQGTSLRRHISSWALTRLSTFSTYTTIKPKISICFLRKIHEGIEFGVWYYLSRFCLRFSYFYEIEERTKDKYNPQMDGFNPGNRLYWLKHSWVSERYKWIWCMYGNNWLRARLSWDEVVVIKSQCKKEWVWVDGGWLAGLQRWEEECRTHECGATVWPQAIHYCLVSPSLDHGWHEGSLTQLGASLEDTASVRGIAT